VFVVLWPLKNYHEVRFRETGQKASTGSEDSDHAEPGCWSDNVNPLTAITCPQFPAPRSKPRRQNVSAYLRFIYHELYFVNTRQKASFREMGFPNKTVACKFIAHCSISSCTTDDRHLS
jgi:hypothetical protein